MKEFLPRTFQHAVKTWLTVIVEIVAATILYISLYSAGLSNNIALVISAILAFILAIFGLAFNYKIYPVLRKRGIKTSGQNTPALNQESVLSQEMETSVVEVVGQATLVEKRKLRREFKFFDMIFVTMAAIISLDLLSAVTANGAQALTWLIISAITFFIPYGLLTAEIGSTFTQEGGIYVWCKHTGGRFYGALASMLYWIANPFWVGGPLAVIAITAITTFFAGDPNAQIGGSITSNTIFRIVVALFFIWIVIGSTILALRVGKWLSVIGTCAKLVLFALFALFAIIYLLGGHAIGERLTLKDLIPTADWQTISSVIPLLFFNWVGFEIQNGAGEEMVNPQRDVPRSLMRSGIVTVIAYAVPIAAILFTIPKAQLFSQASSVSIFLTTFKTVNSVLPSVLATGLGWLVAIGIVLGVASSGSAWEIGADRSYAIASTDRTGPSFFGRFSNRFGTPIVVNTMSGIVASIAMVAAILFTARENGTIATLFRLVLGFVVSTTTLSYVFIFPAFLWLRYKYPNLKRPYKVPGGMIGAWVVTIVPLAYAVVASIFILWPADATLASNGVDRLTYELFQFIPLAFILMFTIGLYFWGHAEKRNQDVVVEYDLDSRSAVSVTGAGGE